MINKTKTIIALVIIQFVLSSSALARVVKVPHVHTKMHAETKIYKIKRERISGKEGAKDIPGWAKYYRPYKGESGTEFAARIMNEKYGEGNYKTGSETEHSRIKKWADRSFVDPD